MYASFDEDPNSLVLNWKNTAVFDRFKG